HILIAVASGAAEDEKTKAKAKAQDFYQQLKQAPGRFGELAKKFSQDPGSAEKGGDLGWFERGFMVKPFEDAVFNLKAGEISQPVETQYGYHIIRLDAITPLKTTPLEKVNDQLVEEIRKSRVQRAFGEAAQKFGDMVYEQYESLKPVAEALNLTIQTSNWVSRAGGNSNPILNNSKLLEAVFSAESLNDKRNTEAIEVQPNMLMSARVVERKPAATLPFADVQSNIIDHLRMRRASELTEKEGRETLDKLRKVDAPKLEWSPARFVSLQRLEGLHAEAAQAVFGADTSKLPAYVGVTGPEGRFVIYRVSKVRDVESVSPDQVQAARRQLSQLAAQAQFQSYLASLRAGTEVKINIKKLDAGQ
ncbi:MAG: peptidylprolyl isomerase, partial [Burkholderiales bacterium]